MTSSLNNYIQNLLRRRNAVAVLLALFVMTAGSARSLAANEDIAGPDLTPFHLKYEATYRGFKAEAIRALAPGIENQYQMSSYMELTLFGRAIISIRELSTFDVPESGVRPLTYSFNQEGIGSRTRRLHFENESGQIVSTVNDNVTVIPLDGQALDEQSALLYLRDQVRQGNTDIRFTVADRDKLEENRYQVSGSDRIETSRGVFNTVRVERIRSGESKRSTTLWLAPEWGYIVVKLEQIDPDNQKLELTLAEGTYGDRAITPASLTR